MEDLHDPSNPKIFHYRESSTDPRFETEIKVLKSNYLLPSLISSIFHTHLLPVMWKVLV
jgi:hypothetical protein